MDARSTFEAKSGKSSNKLKFIIKIDKPGSGMLKGNTMGYRKQCTMHIKLCTRGLKTDCRGSRRRLNGLYYNSFRADSGQPPAPPPFHFGLAKTTEVSTCRSGMVQYFLSRRFFSPGVTSR